MSEPGQAYAYMVRSPHAHGLLRGVSVESAKGMPGVLAIYIAADLTAYGSHKSPLDFKQRDGSMEPRAGLCSYDAASGRWTLSVPGPGVWGQKGQLVDMLGVTPDKVRIRTGHVGGSFGMKGSIYPEYLCLAHAARALGPPVKWTDERSGSFLSTSTAATTR